LVLASAHSTTDDMYYRERYWTFKTAMIDDNLAIAGELTWKEVFESIESFYAGKAEVYPF
jgi:hypothetical protein